MTRQSFSARKATLRLFPSVAAALAIGIFVVDTVTDSEIAVAVLYAAVVLMSARFCRARGVAQVALGCAALTLLTFYMTPQAGPASTGIINTLISLLGIGWTAYLTLQSQSAEAELQQQANLLDLSHDSIFLRDMNNVISYWSRGAEELYGWKRAEAVGKISHELLETSFPAPLDQINAELEGTGWWEGEIVHKKRDGTRVVVTSRWSLQRDKRERPIAVLEPTPI